MSENQFGIKLRKILEVIGTIGAPPGMIAIFCQVIDVPPRTTAALSLATVFLVLLCMYRRHINERMRSSVVLGMFVVLSTIFFLNYENFSFR